jgi:hypothetical protein
METVMQTLQAHRATATQHQHRVYIMQAETLGKMHLIMSNAREMLTINHVAQAAYGAHKLTAIQQTIIVMQAVALSQVMTWQKPALQEQLEAARRLRVHHATHIRQHQQAHARLHAL